MLLKLLGDYSNYGSNDNNTAKLVNMYIEEDANNAKYPFIAYSRPGLASFNAGSGSVVRGGIEHRSVPYFVVDNTLYSYASNGTRSSKGTLNTSSGQIQLAAISNQINIVDGSYGYNYNVDTNTFTVISDADFPSNPTFLTAQDEYFLVTGASSRQVYGSDIADGLSWSALSFASKTGPGDYVNGLISNKEVIYVLGTRSSDVWSNSGAATFSFEPIGLGSYFDFGCAAPLSIAKGNDQVFFLGQSQGGGTDVILMDGYKPQAISMMDKDKNRHIARKITSLTTISDATGFCYQIGNHYFYLLMFPTEGVSFQFDLSTKLWSEVQSYVSSAYTRFLGNCHVYAYGKHLIGAYNSGAIYYMSTTTYQDAGAQIKRELISPPGYAEGKKVFCSRVQIDVQTNVGSNLTANLYTSKDSGATYGSAKSATIPSTGNRMYWNGLGMTQNAFVLKITCTENANFVILGGIADIHVGIS